MPISDSLVTSSSWGLMMGLVSELLLSLVQIVVAISYPEPTLVVQVV